MLWRCWFHLDAVNTSVWQASMFLWLYLRTPGFQGRILCARNISPMASEDSAPYFCDNAATMTLPRPVRGSPRIQNMACDSDLLLENSRHPNIEYDRVELFTA
jgi:hypothetical protein